MPMMALRGSPEGFLAQLGLVTRARLTQIMNLLLLAPDIQEAILIQAGDAWGMPERRIRRLVAIPFWDDQRRLLGVTKRSGQ